MNSNLSDIVNMNEDPEETFELLDLIGTLIHFYILLFSRFWIIWCCL